MGIFIFLIILMIDRFRAGLEDFLVILWSLIFVLFVELLVGCVVL